jgi:hypothetical protein
MKELMAAAEPSVARLRQKPSALAALALGHRRALADAPRAPELLLPDELVVRHGGAENHRNDYDRERRSRGRAWGGTGRPDGSGSLGGRPGLGDVRSRPMPRLDRPSATAGRQGAI